MNIGDFYSLIPNEGDYNWIQLNTVMHVSLEECLTFARHTRVPLQR